jgi:hypothetical protein
MRQPVSALDAALRKLSRQYSRSYGGFLTTTEALALIDNGAKPSGNPSRVKDSLRDLQGKGMPGPHWFYCTLHGRSLERGRKLKIVP